MLDLQRSTMADHSALEAIPGEEDPILYWNDVALEANRVSHTDGSKEQNGPTLSARALAIVHLAMYDAFAGVARAPGNPLPNLPPYLPGLPPADPSASAAAAVSAAAYRTLVSLFPSRKSFFDLSLAAAPMGTSGQAQGRSFGLLVADRMLDDRKDDPDAGDGGYAPSMARGRHRVDPDNPGQGFYSPFYGTGCKLFAVTDRWELDAPPMPTPAPGDAEYIAALEQVRGLGIASNLAGTVPPGTFRNLDQELIGLFWAYDGASGLGTPPRLYNQIVREIAINRTPPNTVAENARLFALINVAMADAGVLAWDQKYIWDLWRPVLGIREHDASTGPSGVANPTDNDVDDTAHISWLPLGAPNSNATAVRAKNGTPPFPAYPSGHATFGAAAFQITRLFYGVPPLGTNLSDNPFDPDDLFDGLTFVSDELNGVNKDNKGTIRPRHVRAFPDGLRQMIQENSQSRIYLGVHWSFDGFVEDIDGNPDLSRNVGGVPLGLRIAEDIFASGMTKSTVPPRGLS
ncbi:MAG: hypothetical protein ACRDJF_05910 [Actinomycetota bacterium]